MTARWLRLLLLAQVSLLVLLGGALAWSGHPGAGLLLAVLGLPLGHGLFTGLHMARLAALARLALGVVAVAARLCLATALARTSLPRPTVRETRTRCAQPDGRRPGPWPFLQPGVLDAADAQP
ncbi:MAG: hypothetical protein ACYC22_06810 [Thiomonas delicata]